MLAAAGWSQEATQPATAPATQPATAPRPLRIETKRFSAPDTAYAPAGTGIAAGGVNSPIHQARVRITLVLPPGKSEIVKVSLIKGGAGNDPDAALWRAAPPRVRATLRFDPVGAAKPEVLTYGDPAPLSLTTTGVLLATLTSSNSPESTTIKVQAPNGLIATSRVAFLDPTLKIHSEDAGHLTATTPYLPKFSVTLDGEPVDGHLIKVCADSVGFGDDDGRDIKRQAGITEFNALNLSSYVDVGGDGQMAYYLSRTDEPQHVVAMSTTDPTLSHFGYQASDISTATAETPPGNLIGDQWRRLYKFLEQWETGDPSRCANAFAGDNHFPGKLTLAQALITRGDRTGWVQRMRFPVDQVHDLFPLLFSITTFWTLPPADGKTAHRFHATTEFFDIKMEGITPCIVGYSVKDVTTEQFAAAWKFIQIMTDRLNSDSLQAPVRVASGVSAAIASAQIGDSSRFWSLLQTLHQQGLTKYPEQLTQIQTTLTSIAKNDPVPPECQKLAAELLSK